VPADELDEVVRSKLLERRVAMASGMLDDLEVSDLSATLMTLDATGDEHIELRLNACQGAIEAGLTLVDVIDVLGVPVWTTALGVVSGGPVAVLAAGARRLMARHARLHLREPDDSVSGRAMDIERAVAHQAARRAAFYRRLAAFTGRTPAEIEAEWAVGRYLDAEDAISLGYADDVAGPPAP